VPVRIDQCPSCNGEFEIRELYCPACDITMRGRFAAQAPSPFARLNDEQEAFLRLFVLSRGNLSDVERSLGVSYPTVRAKLDDLIAAFAQPSDGADIASEPPLSRTDVLARVADGRLSTEEGMVLLRQLAAEA
jgi:hypothetical protein